jgi:hypothetical protein
MAASASRSFAQAEYDELPFYQLNGKSLQNYNLLRTSVPQQKSVEKMLRGEEPLNAQVFETYFKTAVFPLFAQSKAVKIGERQVSPLIKSPNFLPPADMRTAFQRDYLKIAKDARARDLLADLTIASMEQIADGNFHPACRANAVMMIASLTEPTGPPLKKAFPSLFRRATSDKSIDVVRIPALQGLLRHAVAGIDPAQRPAVIKAMLAIATQHTATPQQSLEGHDWILRRSIDVLGAIGEPGDKGAVFNELVKLVEDETAPRSARALAAETLPKVHVTPPKDYDAEGLAKSLAKLAVETYKGELAEASSKRRPIVVDRLKEQIGKVRDGLVGVDGKGGIGTLLTAEPQKKFAADIVSHIETLTKACDTPAAVPPDFNNPQVVQTTLPGVPFDTQEPIAKAIGQAGGGLEAVLQAGVGGSVAPAGANPTGLPGDVPPPGPGGARPAPVSAPAALPGVPGG